MAENNGLQNEGKKQSKSNNGNRVEFRLSKNGYWIYESMAKFLWQKGYISKPTVGEAARFCFDRVATKYMDQGETITQKLKTIIPIREYNKLEQELASTEGELAAEKKMNSLNHMAIETHVKAFESQSQELENVRNALKNEQKEFSAFRVITARIGEKMQEIAKGGGYIKHEAAQAWFSLGIILNERQTPLTEGQSNSFSN